MRSHSVEGSEVKTDPRFSVNHNLGQFLDMEGNRVTEPLASAPLVIVAGPWESMPPGAMQEKCKVCKRLVGVDPRSQGFLAQPGKVHTVMCRDCWEGFTIYREKGVAGLSEWLDGMEKQGVKR
jgi:uncharacterized protein YlaI